MNGLRRRRRPRQPRPSSSPTRRPLRERADELAAIDTMLEAVIAARGRKYLMMNAPGGHARGARGAPAGARVADRHPARARGHDRDPLRRRRRRGLGPPAAPQGRRRVGHPRPARSRRSSRDRATGADAGSTAAVDTRCAASTCAAVDGRRPGRRRATTEPSIRRGAVPDPAVREAARATLADVRSAATRPSARPTQRVGGGRPDGRLVIERRELRRRPRRPVRATSAAPSTRRSPTSAASPRPSGPSSTRTTIAPGIEIERRWSPLASVGAYVPGRLARRTRRRWS